MPMPSDQELASRVRRAVVVLQEAIDQANTAGLQVDADLYVVQRVSAPDRPQITVKISRPIL